MPASLSAVMVDCEPDIPGPKLRAINAGFYTYDRAEVDLCILKSQGSYYSTHLE